MSGLPQRPPAIKAPPGPPAGRGFWFCTRSCPGRSASTRHCEPTGRANARPMTGSAKQSTARQRQDGLLRRYAPRNDEKRVGSSYFFPHHEPVYLLGRGGADDFFVEQRRCRRQLGPHQRDIERGVETAIGVTNIGVIGDPPAQIENAA